MSNTPIYNPNVTPEEVTAAETYYWEHKPSIAARTLLCEETAVALHGAYLGHKQAKNHGAAAWLVYAVGCYKDFYGEDNDAQ